MNNYLAAEARNHRVCSGLYRLYHVGIFALPLSFALIYLSLFVNYIDAFYGTVGFTIANPMLNDDMAVLFVAGLTIIFVISVIKLVEYKSDFLYKYRWLIGMTVAILAVAFKISGSSLGMWSIMLLKTLVLRFGVYRGPFEAMSSQLELCFNFLNPIMAMLQFRKS